MVEPRVTSLRLPNHRNQPDVIGFLIPARCPRLPGDLALLPALAQAGVIRAAKDIVFMSSACRGFIHADLDGF